MKKIKNLLIAILTLVTFNSFSTPVSYTVTYNSTSNVICNVGDTLKFYGTTPSGYGVSINGSSVISVHPCMSSPFYIGYHLVSPGDNSFSINTSVVWSGSITVNIATGVKESFSNSANDLMAFPNPSNGEFKVKFDSNKEKNDLIIYDIQGRLVLENKDERSIGKNEVTINNDFASGIYIVKVENKSFKITIVR